MFWKATPTQGPSVMLQLEKPQLSEDTATCTVVANDV